MDVNLWSRAEVSDEIRRNKYQTKFINELIDQLWVKTREIKNSRLAIDIMGLLAEVKTSINDTELSHSES